MGGRGRNVKRFSDFAKDEIPFDGTKVKIEEVLNEEITVLGFDIRTSRYASSNSPRYLKIHCEKDGARHVIFTGSTILCGQAERYASEVPFVTVIKKIDKYYSFT